MAGQGMVIVTGAGRGIGAAIARRLGREGYAVAVNYGRSRDAAEAVVAAIRDAGGTAAAIQADMADAGQIEPMFAAAEAALGPLAALVNNAGILGPKARFDEQGAEGLAHLMAVNVIAPMLCLGAAVRRLSTRHGGRGGAVVNIGSIAARLGGLPGLVPYAASKGAVETFTKGAAGELALEGIRVNAVAPGLTATEMVPAEMAAAASSGAVPMGRIGQPEEIAEAVAFLLSPAASYMTGSVMTVSGGR